MSQYTIHTVPHNLGKEETVVQIVEALDHLKAITQDIFSRINKRLDTNLDNLSSISKRIEAAGSKVDSLKGDKKAKTVFSSSKYPAVDVNRDYVSVFTGPINVVRVRHEVKHRKYAPTYEPLNKLQFFHVKLPDTKDSDIPQGFGNVPQDVKYINDLLLFNTGKNVYKDFTASDLLKGPDQASNSYEYYATSELGPAPLSISQRSSMHQGNKETYFYTPKIEELPALDVPWDLPDLPGIADDIRYDSENSPIIAPPSASMTATLASLDLPDLPDLVEEAPGLEPSPPPPPPPPPPPQDIPQPTATILSPPIETKMIAQPLNPEPPTVAPPPPTLSPINDSRASLMDAIRKAGGSKNLKKTSQESSGSTKQPSSGDLMADLHSKLMMRRKGISGSKTSQTALTPDSTLAMLSSIIPPPTKSSDVGSGESTDDEAWNDDD